MRRPSPLARTALLRANSTRRRLRCVSLASVSLICASAAVAACTSAPPAHPPILVGEPDATPVAASEPEDTPSARPKATPFATFLRDFQADYLESPESVEQHVSPELGLFLLLNAGAFQRATYHTSFRELLARTDDWARLPTELTCGTSARPWVTVDGGFPKYSCDEERYLTDQPCSMGTLSSGELRNIIRLSGEYELETPERVAELTQHANDLEPRITHYAFDTEHHLGLMFGEVDGVWRLLFVRTISPCSA